MAADIVWCGTMSAVIRRAAEFDRVHRVRDGPRRVVPEPLPVQKWISQELQEKDKVAPWSKPRGYDTTILEEAYAFKAAMREMRRQENIKKNKVAPADMATKPKRLKKTRSWHFRGLLPTIDLKVKERLTRLIGTLFCIRAETEAYIQCKKVDGAV